MNRIDILKELIEKNLHELNKNTHIKNLSIKFEGDEFTVIDKENKVVLKDNLSNYDLDFESQKRFILNVVKDITLFAKILDDSESKYLSDLLKLAGADSVDVLGQGIIFLNDADYIRIYLEKFGLDNDDYTEQDYVEHYTSLIKYFIKEIRNNLSGDNIKVVLYYDENGRKIGFYINGVMYEDKIHIYFKNESNKEDNSTLYKTVTLCYSLTSEEELEKAVEFIEELVS